MASLDQINGPFLMGTVISVFLYGIMVVQCHLYWTWYKRDKYMIKFVVALLLLLDTTSCALDVWMTYDYLVTGFGNFAQLMLLNNGLILYPLMTGISAFVVQCFYGWRIKSLTNVRLLSFLVYALSTVQLLASIGTTIGGIIIREFIHLDRTKAVSLVWLIGASTTDVVISVALVWYLRKGRTGYRATDDIITKLTRTTIQTGLLTTVFSIAVIIAFFLSERTTIHIAIGLPISKLYSTSLLSTLNARRFWIPLNQLRKFPTQGKAHLKHTTDSSTNVEGQTSFSVQSSQSQYLYAISANITGDRSSGVELTSNVQFSPTSPTGASGTYATACTKATGHIRTNSSTTSPGSDESSAGETEKGGVRAHTGSDTFMRKQKDFEEKYNEGYVLEPGNLYRSYPNQPLDPEFGELDHTLSRAI